MPPEPQVEAVQPVQPAKLEARLLPTPSEITSYLDRFVFGQEQAKRDLAVSIYNHYLALAYRDRTDSRQIDFGKQHILLFGPTGTGKTYMVKTVAQMLGVPVSFATATSLVETGYVGTPVDSLMRNLLTTANNDVYLAQRGIVFIDEIDKIRRTESGARDVSGEGVQNGLLTLLDGCVVPTTRADEKYQVDSGQVLFICTGAFVGLTDIIQRRLGRTNKFGFQAAAAEQEVTAQQEADWLLTQVAPEDLQEFGFIPEFIGRFSCLSALTGLSKQGMLKILTETEGSILEKQTVLFALHGIDLEFTPEALAEIAEQALELGTGARGLARILLKCLDAVDWRLPELAAEGVTAIVITRDAVCGNSAPEFRRAAPGTGQLAPQVQELRQRALLPSLLRPAPPQSSRRVLTRETHRQRNESWRGFTDATGWSDDELREAIELVKAESLDWGNTTGSARKWWDAFEKENQHRLRLVLRLLEELVLRRATITEFFLAYIYSNTDNIQANLHYLDYTRIKKEDERKKSGGGAKKEPEKEN